MDERRFPFRVSMLIALTIAALSVLVQGCAIYRDGTQEVSTCIESLASSRAEAGDLYARLSPSQPAKSVSESATAQSPTLEHLRDFIVLALERNADLKASEATARSKVERIRQVTALPDPMLATKTLPEPVRTAEGDNYFILGISQKLPVPEKLDRAGRIALEETRISLQRLQETRLRVIADVKRVYFQLYILDNTISVTGENQELLRGLIDVARAQLAAGRRPQDDVLRAQVELSNLESELVALRHRRVSTAARLNQLVDRSPMTPVPSPEEFDLRRTEFVVDELFSKAMDENPALEGLRRQIERDREAVRFAKLAYWPDFSIGFEWMSMRARDAFQPPPNPQTGLRPVVSRMSEAGSDNWAITFGINLPIWFDKIEGGVEEARRRLTASQQQFVSMKNRVSFEITDALERVRSEKELAELFRDTIIPQAEQTYRVSQASYTAGRSDFLYVIDNWRKWLVFTIQYYRSMGELERSVADLEQAIGLSLSEVGGP